MEMNKFLKASLPVAIAFSLVACGGSDNTATMTLSAKNLEALGSNFDYEGWIIIPGSSTPVSTGKFDIVDGKTVPASFDLDLTQANAASTFVLTIEPTVGDDPGPAATHILAGNIEKDGADSVANIVTNHSGAFNSDFTESAGTFILATPSNGPTTSTQGIWYLNPPVAPATNRTPSLTLPTLPAGWNYEGWVVGADGPTSTGTFTNVALADSDGAGPAKGPLNDGPPFPGQDFVNPAKDLIGLTSVISVEPSPDNSPAPFSMKPLAKPNIAASGNVLNNISATNLPSATVTIKF